MITIRKVVFGDLPALVGLNQAVQAMHAAAFPNRFRKDVPDDVIARAFATQLEAPTSHWLLAEEKEPVAFLSAEFRDRPENWCGVAHRVCYLAGIVVAPKLRRKGVARALVEQLKHDARERGVGEIELDVWSFNEAAARTFSSLGFKPLMQRLSLTV